MQMATLSSKCAIVFTAAVQPAPVEAEEVAKTDRPPLGGPPGENTPSIPASSTRSGSCDHPPAIAPAYQDCLGLPRSTRSQLPLNLRVQPEKPGIPRPGRHVPQPVRVRHLRLHLPGS